MKPPRHHKSVTTYVHGVEVVCVGVIFYPAEPATDLEPADPPMAEWDHLLIGGVEVNELFHGKLGKDLEESLIGQLEDA